MHVQERGNSRLVIKDNHLSNKKENENYLYELVGKKLSKTSKDI